MPNDSLRVAPEAAAPNAQTPPTICPEPTPLMMTAAELARELRTSVKTIRRLDQSGRLPRGMLVGHGRRWPRETIVRWIGAGCPRRAEWEAFHAAPPQGKRR